MTNLSERDAMVCRACGKEERASEGSPCEDCGTFICLMCGFRGVTLCAKCIRRRSASGNESDQGPPATPGEPAGAT